MPKILVLVNEAWPVFSFGSIPENLDGTEVDQETYQRWSDAIRAYQSVQAELEKIHHEQETR